MAIFDERKLLKEDEKVNLLIKTKPKQENPTTTAEATINLKRWRLFLNISPILGLMSFFLIGPFGIFIFPLVIGLYKNQSVKITRNCISLLNFLLSWTLYSLITAILIITIVVKMKFVTLIGFILFIPLFALIFCLNNAIQVYLDKPLFYPLRINIIRLKIDKKKNNST